MTAPCKETLADGVEIWLGDCRDVLPLVGRVDAVVTDPPYGINKDGQAKTTGGHGGRKAHEFMGWDKERPDPSLFDLLCSNSDYQIIWGGNYFADLLPAGEKRLVWDKGQRIRQSDCELAYTNLRGALRIFELNRVALLIDGAEHPTQKPVEIMTWCLQQLPKDAETILDPFMGSGTTGVACVNLGRSFIGVERELKYFDIAHRRISKALAEPRFSFEAPTAPKQEALF